MIHPRRCAGTPGALWRNTRVDLRIEMQQASPSPLAGEGWGAPLASSLCLGVGPLPSPPPQAGEGIASAAVTAIRHSLGVASKLHLGRLRDGLAILPEIEKLLRREPQRRCKQRRRELLNARVI